MTNDEARIVRAGLALDDKDDEVRTTNHSGIVFHTVAERLWIRKEVAFACGSAERRPTGEIWRGRVGRARLRRAATSSCASINTSWD